MSRAPMKPGKPVKRTAWDLRVGDFERGLRDVVAFMAGSVYRGPSGLVGVARGDGQRYLRDMTSPHATHHSPFVEVPIQVRYAETDAQRVVYHGNYLIWFEVGRTAYCERAGYPYPRMEAEGILIIVSEVRVKYRKSCRYGDVVTIRTRMGEQKSRGCSFLYEVVLPDGSIAAEGETHHLFVQAATSRTCSVPPGIREAFLAFTGS